MTSALAAILILTPAPVVQVAEPPPPVVVSLSPAPTGPSQPIEAQSAPVGNYVITPTYPPAVVSVPTVPPSPGGMRAIPATPGVLPTVPIGPHIVRLPVPRKPLQDYVTPADYPQPALAMRQHGWVDFTLTVDKAGRVAGCEVTVSSGSPSLDFATCRVLRSRARFTPAMDSTGNPAVATFSQDVEWKLPEH